MSKNVYQNYYQETPAFIRHRGRQQKPIHLVCQNAYILCDLCRNEFCKFSNNYIAMMRTALRHKIRKD